MSGQSAEIGRSLNVNAAQVYMAKQRVGKIFREEMERAQEKEELS